LYIAKQIADAHRASLDGESTPETGTTFAVQIPASGAVRSRAVFTMETSCRWTAFPRFAETDGA
jgi:hypothetical protein